MSEENITIRREEEFLAELGSDQFQPPPPVVSDKQREKTGTGDETTHPTTRAGEEATGEGTKEGREGVQQEATKIQSGQ